MNAEHLMLQISQTSPLDAALTAFLLDREAVRCTLKTLAHYRYTCGGFVEWLRSRGISDDSHVTPHHIRAYLVSLQRRGHQCNSQQVGRVLPVARPQSPVRQPSRLITQTRASGRRQLSVMPLSLTEWLAAF